MVDHTLTGNCRRCEACELRREGMDPAYGIDGFLAGLARGLNKRIDALETPAQQVQALLAPDATQRQHAVAHALDDLDNGAGVDDQVQDGEVLRDVHWMASSWVRKRVGIETIFICAGLTQTTCTWAVSSASSPRRIC